MSCTKNPIKEQLESFYDELTEARKYCQLLMRVLSSLNNDSDIEYEIKMLIQKIPNFNFLKKQTDFIKENLKRVSSKELPPEEAERVIQGIYLQIIDTMIVINPGQL